MKRLQANNISSEPIRKEVEKQITDPNGNRWRVQYSQNSFLISKRLLSSLPIVPTNERVYELAKDIEIGRFEDISSLDECMENKYWDQWRQRTIDILIEKGIFI